jgi:hypothetical protein
MGLPEQGFRALGGFGKAMNEYFRWNFSQAPQSIAGYGDMVKAGLPSNQAFGAGLVGTGVAQYGMSNVLRGRDRETRKPTFGDNYDSNILNPIYDWTVKAVLGDEGKIQRKYGDYVGKVYEHGGKDADVLSEDAYNAFKDRTYNAGGIFRYNEAGKGSEVPNRDTLTVFNKTIVNPFYAYDSTIGAATVDKLTAVGTGLTLAGSAAALYEPTQLAAAGTPLPVYNSSGDLVKGAQNARMSAQVIGGGLAKIAGVAGSIYGGVVDYAESKKAGDSDFRAGANAIASTAIGLEGAKYGARLGSRFGWPGIAIGVIGGGLIGNYAGGWLSDRGVDLVEKRDRPNDVYSAVTEAPLYALPISSVFEQPARQFAGAAGDWLRDRFGGNSASTDTTNYSSTKSSEPSEDIFARGEKRIGGLVDKYDRENSTGAYAPTSSAPQVDYKAYDYRATKTYADMQNFANNFNPSKYGGANYDYIGTDYQAPASVRSQYNDAQNQYQQFLKGK